MPRFYFHARGPGHEIRDQIGEELLDAESARNIALRVIQDLLSDPLDGADFASWIMEIADENERVVLTIPFRTAVLS